MPKKLKFFITSLEKYIRQIKLDFFLMNLKLNITGCSTNPVGEKSPTGFFICKKEKSRL